MAFRRVLVVDDEESIRHVLTVLLHAAGYDVRAVGDGASALKEIEANAPDVVLTDVRMPGLSGVELLAKARELHPGLTVIVMTAYGTLDGAIEAMRAGAYDYVSKPFRPDEVVLVLKKAEERERLWREHVQVRQATRERTLRGMVGAGAAFERLSKLVNKVADSKVTVLVTGESGTGKELVARAIHELSPRAEGPFVAVNCGAIPESLMESELFGHVRGAFTDAKQSRKGLFEEADGGTLFLDEVGELPLAMQVKLLRVLQEEELRRVGDSRSVKVDVRVVAATVRDLPSMVAAGSFREDLWYRLNVVQVPVPALRDRPEDIAPLVAHFVASRRSDIAAKVQGFTADALHLLEGYAWPGNVRELENVVERAMVLADGEWVGPEGLPDHVLDARPVEGSTKEAAPPQRVGTPTDTDGSVHVSVGVTGLALRPATNLFEAEMIRRALAKTNGNRTKAAVLLELSHRALLYKLKEYGIT